MNNNKLVVFPIAANLDQRPRYDITDAEREDCRAYNAHIDRAIAHAKSLGMQVVTVEYHCNTISEYMSDLDRTDGRLENLSQGHDHALLRTSAIKMFLDIDKRAPRPETRMLQVIMTMYETAQDLVSTGKTDSSTGHFFRVM